MQTAESKNEFLRAEWFESWRELGVEVQPRAVVVTETRSGTFDVTAAETGVSGAAASDHRPLSKTSDMTATFPAGKLSDTFFILDRPLTEQTAALLQRMVEAMGIENSAAIVATGDGELFGVPLSDWQNAEPSPIQARVTIALGPSSHADAADYRTHSLDEVLQNPSLKRPVWNELQKAMQKLSS